MKKIFFFIIVICLLFAGNKSFSQSISAEVISNSGEMFISNSFSLNWTLGESVIDVLASDPYIHTQGFHQTYLKTTSLERDLTNSSISVYPNPVKDFLNIKMKKVSGDVNIELYEPSGKKILSKKLDSNENYKLNMKKFANGIYLLHVISKERKTFNIIKSSKK